jgi:AcrR family transcriptional regulator
MAKKLPKSAHSQQRVLDAAAKIFRDYGYAGTTMRAIAEEADLQAGSIYYHYKSKDDLIGAVLDIGITAVTDSVRQAMASLPDDADGFTRIETAVRAHLTAIIEFGDYTLATRRVFGQVPEAIRAKNLKLRDSYAAMWQQILEVAQRNGELRNDASLTLARLFILGALNWTVEWYKPGGRSIDQVAHEFAGLITSGLRKQAVPSLAVEAAPPVRPRAARSARGSR